MIVIKLITIPTQLPNLIKLWKYLIVLEQLVVYMYQIIIKIQRTFVIKKYQLNQQIKTELGDL